MITPIIEKDTEQLTMTVTVDLDVPVERAWRLWADPRQLERWWGPPGYPATFTEHALTPGARVQYFMTSPEGETHGGYWDVLEVDPPRRLQVRDGFADADGTPSDFAAPGIMTITLDERDGGTRMRIESQFPSLETMEQLLAMGQEEGMAAALGQIDGVLADVG